jgi:hypothetical protein
MSGLMDIVMALKPMLHVSAYFYRDRYLISQCELFYTVLSSYCYCTTPVILSAFSSDHQDPLVMVLILFITGCSQAP